MKRKSKKLKKSTPTPKATEQAHTQEIKQENQLESEDITSVKLNDDLIDADSIKKEQETNEVLKEDVNHDISNSLLVKSDVKFLFIELKLISIDIKCVDYEKLEQRFLCVDSKASIEHVKKFILKKMNILADFFEVTSRDSLILQNN